MLLSNKTLSGLLSIFKRIGIRVNGLSNQTQARGAGRRFEEAKTACKEVCLENSGSICKECGREDNHVAYTAVSAPAAAVGSRVEIDTANLYKRLTFTWLSDLIRLGKGKPLEADDLLSLHQSERSNQMAIKFNSYWRQMDAHLKDPLLNKKPNLLLHLLKICKWDIFWAGAGYFLIAFCTLITTFYVGELIGNVKTSSAALQSSTSSTSTTSTPQPYPTSTLSLAFTLFCIQMSKLIFSALCNSHYWKIVQKIPTILTSAVYEKTFRLSIQSKKKYSIANILNIVNQDIDMIKGGSDFFLGIFAPFEIAASCFFLWKLLGAAFVSSMVVVAIVFASTTFLAQKTATFMMQWRQAADARIASIRELIQAMKIVKLFSLESHFYSKISQSRQTQLSHLKAYWRHNASMRAVSLSASTLIAVLSFAVYAGLGHPMSSEIVFPALMLFDMSEAFRMLGYSTNVATQAWLGIQHVDLFLCADEVAFVDFGGEIDDALAVIEGVWEYEGSADDILDSTEGPLSVTNQYQSLHSSTVSNAPSVPADAENAGFRLNLGSLKVPVGSFVGICGQVGSGKSTLLKCLLGEVTKVHGSIFVNGSIAYCSQDPWIMKGSISENILFKSPLDQSRLDRTIRICGLHVDIQSFPNGVNTQIGESGVNLSGGQKSRVCLARAVYANADVYLLDDPLSSSDAAVAASIMKELIRELQGKTICLVTHSLEQLSLMEWVLALDNGYVVDFGLRDDVMNKKNSLVLGLMREEQGLRKRSSVSPSLPNPDFFDEGSHPKQEWAHLPISDFMVREDKETGHVRFELYERALTPIRPILPILIGLFVWCVFSAIASPLWLVHWTTSESTESFYMYTYILLGSSLVISNICLYCVFAYCGVCISEFFHDGALRGLLKSTMNFFDINPVGRIINRMTSDVSGLDTSIAQSFSTVSIAIVNCLSVLVIVCGNKYPLIFLFVFIFYLSFAVFKYYRPTYLEVRRLSTVLKSPLQAHINESLNGISIIKAFKKESIFTNQLRCYVDRVEAASYIYHSVILWFEQRLGLLSSIVFISIALIGCIPNASKDYAAFIGVSLTYSSSLTEAIERLLTSLGSGEASMNSIERLDKYATGLPVEGAAELPQDPTAAQWPQKGAISVKNLSIAYEQRPDYDVIKNISFEVMAGEKIGICGRSGCGKSTLVSSLFRLLERRTGIIEIDGLDIAKLGLKTLRSRLQIVPQDPVLFEGSIRSNLGLNYTDQELWDALDHVGLKDFVSDLERKLDSPVFINGSNLSFGQRQLFSLCRAMLAKPKILVLDEATASIDGASDERINYIIKNHFKDTTILSIAHRLDSIGDFDRIMLIDNGELAEFDSPSTLLSDSGSKFSALVAASMD